MDMVVSPFTWVSDGMERSIAESSFAVAVSAVGSVVATRADAIGRSRGYVAILTVPVLVVMNMA